MIGQTIRDLRKLKKMSQSELAKVVGVSQTTVTAWETGKAEPSSSAISSLADYFKEEGLGDPQGRGGGALADLFFLPQKGQGAGKFCVQISHLKRKSIHLV